MQKIFYDKFQNKTITDISGEKTLEEIQEKFSGEYEFAILDDDTCADLDSNGISLYSISSRSSIETTTNDLKKKNAKKRIKSKLKLSDNDLDDLRSIL